MKKEELSLMREQHINQLLAIIEKHIPCTVEAVFHYGPFGDTDRVTYSIDEDFDATDEETECTFWLKDEYTPYESIFAIAMAVLDKFGE